MSTLKKIKKLDTEPGWLGQKVLIFLHSAAIAFLFFALSFFGHVFM